ncbi:MAG: PGPGW domain-containing protein [Gammaproteobacteria bacterium]|nr:PGPGW domain-containing protein [Gammaproteobacteria bacterium]
MKYVRKTLVSVVGLLIVLIGLIFIILPGPAILIIPLGLALLATEYEFARRWLKKFQVYSRRSAAWADRKWRNFKYRR